MMVNVLYVDDNAEYRNLVRTFFCQKIKIPFQVVASAQEAIELLQVQPFTLVISDYQMPVANGDAIFSFITQNDLQTLFVLFTAHAIDSDLKSKFAGIKFAGFVENKNLEDLATKVIFILSRSFASTKSE